MDPYIVMLAIVAIATVAMVALNSGGKFSVKKGENQIEADGKTDE